MISQDGQNDSLEKNNKNLGERPHAPIWSFFIEGEEIDSGHRSVSCRCVELHIKEAVRMMVEAYEEELTLTNRKRKAAEDQQNIDSYFESMVLSDEQKAAIDIALIKLFVCGVLSWCLVEHSFFIEFVQQLQPAYCLPLYKMLASTLLDNEILCVHTKIYKILEKEKNLTLVENLDAVAQIHSYYIANNKFELLCYSVEKSVEDIQKILYDADLYEETNNITFEQAIINANINQTSIDDDNDIVSEEVFKLEETLNLSNLSFLPDENRQAEADMVDDNALDAESSNWLEEFNQEEDYDPAELGKMFLN
ncbi:5855_t:CDS:2 [Cetraspora pellucida]|uniref:5855_t:CDS:1 n=1 Tax=Cetraspora pellucida TaxID=1433469 RepID=A0ACA9KEV4_9GLOM|nr:5855_t:CDS:2 [Cetraspora pellucida]